MTEENNTFKLDRRRFIKGAGAGTVVAGLATHASLAGAAGSNSGKTPFDYDALVIGGGFAGVTAARDLKQSGYSCAILEARNRLGGRTFYAPYGDKKVELGGTWIHWMQPFIWTEVMRYDMDIIETPGASAERIIQLKDGKAFEPDIATLYGDLFAGGQAITDKARQVWPRPFDTEFSKDRVLEADNDSIQDLLHKLKLTESQMALFERVLGGAVNAKTSNVSASEALRILALCGHNIGSYYDVNARYQLKDGTIALINKMVEDGKPDVRLNSAVKRIEQKPDHVVVTTATGETITAATVVCTVPLNVLKDVEFFPALHPHKLAASKEGHPGRGFKVYAQIKGKIPNVLLYGDHNEPMDEILAYHIGEDSSLLLGFGHDRSQFDIYDDRHMQATLRKYLPDIEVTGSFGYDWIYDPYSQGTWCCWAPGWTQKYGEGLRDGPEGRVFFASSDFCEGNRSYIDGAVGSGIKAARQISETLG
jgi:monoamine oxidase